MKWVIKYHQFVVCMSKTSESRKINRGRQQQGKIKDIGEWYEKETEKREERKEKNKD